MPHPIGHIFQLQYVKLSIEANDWDKRWAVSPFYIPYLAEYNSQINLINIEVHENATKNLNLIDIFNNAGLGLMEPVDKAIRDAAAAKYLLQHKNITDRDRYFVLITVVMQERERP